MDSSNRNVNLHPAFRALWPQDSLHPTPFVDVPEGNTEFDPMIGTGWGEYLDRLGAKSPQGARLAGGTLPRSAAPASQTDFKPILDGPFNERFGGLDPNDPTPLAKQQALLALKKRGR